MRLDFTGLDGRKASDVMDELHMMSFHIGQLNRATAKAKGRVRQASQHISATKKQISRMTTMLEEGSVSAE